MTERLGNFGQSEPTSGVSKIDGLVAASVGGASLGVLVEFIGRTSGRSGVGPEVGVGLGGMVAAACLGSLSSEKAMELARQGKTLRAYLKAVEATIESALAMGVPGAAAGFEAAGVKGAIIGGATGVFMGAVGGFNTEIPRVSKTLRANQNHPGS